MRRNSRWMLSTSGSTRSPRGLFVDVGANKAAASAASSMATSAGQSSPATRAAAMYLLTTPLDSCKARAIFSWDKPASNLRRRHSLMFRMATRGAAIFLSRNRSRMAAHQVMRNEGEGFR